MHPLSWTAAFSGLALAVLFAAQVPVANAIISAGVPAALFCAALYLLFPPARGCCRGRTGQADSINTDNFAASSEAPTRTGSGAARSAYLDVLKLFLTCCVVVHHVVGAFNGSGLGLSVGVYRSSFQAFAVPFLSLQQSYFMCLFFFISALFVPRSLARKGAREFLADKAKRLVLPFSVMFWGLFPLLIGVLGAGVITKQVWLELDVCRWAMLDTDLTLRETTVLEQIMIIIYCREPFTPRTPAHRGSYSGSPSFALLSRSPRRIRLLAHFAPYSLRSCFLVSSLRSSTTRLCSPVSLRVRRHPSPSLRGATVRLILHVPPSRRSGASAPSSASSRRSRCAGCRRSS